MSRISTICQKCDSLMTFVDLKMPAYNHVSTSSHFNITANRVVLWQLDIENDGQWLKCDCLMSHLDLQTYAKEILFFCELSCL